MVDNKRVVHCLNCGYSLAAHSKTDICPECGDAVSRSYKAESLRRRQRRLKSVAVTALVRLSLVYLVGNIFVVMFIFILHLHWLCRAWLVASLLVPLLYSVATSIWYLSRFKGRQSRLLVPYHCVLFVIGGINLVIWIDACAP